MSDDDESLALGGSSSISFSRGFIRSPLAGTTPTTTISNNLSFHFPSDSEEPSSSSAYQFHYNFFDFLSHSVNMVYFERVPRGSFLFHFILTIIVVSYYFMILATWKVVLFLFVIPYVGYKIVKKVLSKCRSGGVPNNFLFCCRRGRTQRPEGNFLRKRIVPKVELDFPSDLRVGDTVSFKVIFPLTRHRTIDIVQNQPEAQPSLQEAVYIEEEYSLDKLSIEIVKVSAPPLSGHITPIRELLPRGSEATEDVLLVKFLVQEAGFYQIIVLYEEEHIEGSPFPTPFNPNALDAEKTLCMRESPIALSIAAEFLSVGIRPRDRYGNECNYGDVDPAKFAFQLYQAHETMEERRKVETVVYDFKREIKRTLTEFVEIEETLEVRLEAEIIQPGLFYGVITYDGTVIQNGSFDVVVLLPNEHNILRSMMSDNPGSKYHEARLLQIGSEIQKKARNVYVYVSSKTLTVKEFYLIGLFPFRIATFRILPATKIQVLMVNLEAALTTLAISDRIQPKITIEIDTISSRILMAMYALFLKSRLGGSETFENKQKFFYEELKTSRDVVRTTSISISIQRPTILNSTLSETKNFSVKDWCKNFKVKFTGEEGSDDGGLRREWLNLVCKEIFENNPDGMFCIMGNSRLVHPNPNRDTSKWTLKHYELGGKIVAKCLYETAIGGFYKQMVNARFSRSFLAQIIGFAPHYKYFEQDDPELYISKIKYILENPVASMELTFSEEEYSSSGQLLRTAELVPNGRKIPVTDENKEEYLNALAQYRLSIRMKREIDAFLKGLSEIVPEGLLTNFDENELEILMCGRSTFNIEDLKVNHVESAEGGLYIKILPWFWICLTNMTDDERTRLLQFTTGSSLLPHGGFKELQPTFRITVYDTFGKLPIAHTCFNEICLSDHRRFEDFEKALKIAINEGNEGFAMM